MQRIASTLGLFPLPDAQRDRLADLKGHQKEDLIGGEEPPELTETYDAARERLIDDQHDAGLDRVVEGQARWDDFLAHPLCVHESVRTEGIVRYYDNNNFYREPVVTDELTESGDVAADLRKAAGLTDDLQAVLPGPYSLSALATDEYYGDRATFLDAVAEFLAGEAAAFPDAVETLYLLEPSLVTDAPESGEHERVRDAIDAVVGAVDAEVVVQGYWGTFDEALHGHLLDTDADALGYDLVTAEEAATDLVREHGTTDRVSLGVVDGQNTRVEEPAAVGDRVEAFREAASSGIDAAYLTPNTELFHLPVNKCVAKLRTLATAADPEVAR
ncbi:hypothetical protein JCM30237_17480 [Halolamina litorea]|uniref:5-methyltetrahydropteroyltriglutamate--homocysteine methyltransferase n=1 Tax=Halolamina litorea TaxID=1515593 RepID=A0ABD6BRB4_9EURY|nr:5-methyltetrahydropteroyltriglutamate--homocysteine methyltransferase [Halolamina litorea]